MAMRQGASSASDRTVSTWRVALEAVEFPLALIDEQAALRFVSRPLADLLGSDPETLIADGLAAWCTITRIGPRPAPSDAIAAITRAVDEELPLCAILNDSGGDGEVRALATARRVTPEGWALLNFHDSGSGDGIAGRARAAQLAGQARSRRLADLLIRAGHDLRTPLTAILGLCDLLLYDHPADVEPGTSLNRLRGSAAQLADRFTRMVTYVKVDADRLSVEVERVEPSALVREVCGRWRDRMRSDGIDFRQRIDDSVDRIRCWADRRYLAECIDETLLAFQTLAGGGEVEVASERDDGEVVFAITGRGGRVEPEGDEQFRRADGLGIGLRLAEGLVEAMAGTLRIASEAGDGCRVEVRLPLAD